MAGEWKERNHLLPTFSGFASKSYRLVHSEDDVNAASISVDGDLHRSLADELGVLVAGHPGHDDGFADIRIRSSAASSSDFLNLTARPILK